MVLLGYVVLAIVCVCGGGGLGLGIYLGTHGGLQGTGHHN